MAKAEQQEVRRRRRKLPAMVAELKQLLYTYGQAAQILSISQQSVLRLERAGELERVDVGANQPRVTAASIAAYVERHQGAD